VESQSPLLLFGTDMYGVNRQLLEIGGMRAKKHGSQLCTGSRAHGRSIL